MAEEDTKKVEVGEVSTETTPAKDVAEEREVTPTPPPVKEKADESKSLAVVENPASILRMPKPKHSITVIEVADSPPREKSGSANRDAVLARVETEKRLSLIRAWEESEKTKAENKAAKKMPAVTAWENSKKAAIEAELKKIEESLEKKKAEYAEKMKNKIAIIHKEAEEKRAMVEAKRGEDLLKAEEMAAKYRATGLAPKKIFGCFGS